MVVTGLLLLFGGRADAARVRTGSDQASVDGRVLRRPRRRGRHAGSGTPAASSTTTRAGPAPGGQRRRPLARLRRRRRRRRWPCWASWPSTLLAVHGQSDQLRLARPAAQRGRPRPLRRRRPRASTPRRTGSGGPPTAALADRTGRAAELRRESDLLAHGLAEIEAAAPQPGEGDELAALAARLGHADALTLAARTAHDALLGDGDDPAGEAADVIAAAGHGRARALAQQHGADPELDALARPAGRARRAGRRPGRRVRRLRRRGWTPTRPGSRASRPAAPCSARWCASTATTPNPSVDGVLRWAESGPRAAGRDRRLRRGDRRPARPPRRRRRRPRPNSPPPLSAERSGRGGRRLAARGHRRAGRPGHARRARSQVR